MNILFLVGKTADGIEIKIKAKQRTRVRGEFRDPERKVALRNALLSLRSTDVVEMMARVINPEVKDNVTAQQESLRVLANTVIVYN